MRAPISVIIPTLNAADSLPACLGSLGAGLEAGLIRELIVSDGGSSDTTKKIADAAGATWVDGKAGRGAQIARGVAAAQGDWLLVLHADTLLDTGWANAVLQHLSNVELAGYFQLRFDQAGRAAEIVAAWANLRSHMFGLPYGDQALLISADLLKQVGGYPALPLMEDVAMARKLRGQLKALPVSAETSAQRYVTEGWIRRGAKNLVLLLRYLCGADPEMLAQRYRRSGQKS
ncbi:TIGR04283 family arsenosugar biosynthesis glycosyltransferase [Lentibacter algarum]|nr:TIGR04283 family arsenosugar biosynthesis glycosyltransferase [Lentibacter algarum]